MSPPDSRERDESDPSLRSLRLIECNKQIFAQVNGTGEAFELPVIPKSLTDWLALLGAEFLRRTDRCVAAVLLLHPERSEWRIGIPHQRCSHDASCWTIRPQDFPGVPHDACVGGTFQVRVLSAGERLQDAVPPTDGLHLILNMKEDGQTIWTFLRLGEEVRSVPPRDFIQDDLDEALDKVMGRVELL